MRQVSDDWLLEGIRSGNNEVLKVIYDHYYPMVRKFVQRNNGSYEDARDIFQECVMVILEKSRKDDFRLDCTIKTYLYSVCRNIWLQRLDRSRRNIGIAEIENYAAEEVHGIYADMEMCKKRIYQKHYLSLSDKCREIIELYLQQLPFREIALKMGLGSKQYAIKKKYECIRNLIKRVRNDPEYKRL